MSTRWHGWGDETRRLLRLLAQRERADPEWPPAGAWDWRPFAEACDTHQVVPYVYCRLQGLAATTGPAGLLESLRTRFHEVCARNYYLAKQLVDLTAMLENEGIPALVYKGPALAMAVYGGLSLRHYNDLDLVIRKEHHAKAVHLMTRWGFQIVPKPALPRVRPYLGRPEDPRNVERTQEIEFRAPDSTYYLDLHWQLGDRFWRPFNPDVGKLWERAEWQDLPQGRASTLCREDLFLALCAHGNGHRWVCLKWLLDVAELLRKAQTLDRSRIEEMIKIRPEAAASANVAVTLAHDLLEVTVPPEIERILPATPRTRALATAVQEELLSKGQSSADEHTTLLALEARRVARMKYQAYRIIRYPEGLFREIFVQISPNDRELVRLPNRLQFLYHVIRPVRLVVKHCTRLARTLWLTAA
ncbi:MAG TPA: nucleotidyltransferase family protein [Terriglobia bacterium]|nr:nucleotidyltransferase family protein [Terriglobia bacterium]